MEVSTLEEVLEYIRAGGRIETRLQETGKGDVEFLQRGIWDIPGSVNVTERELILQIHELEERGLVEACYAPHPYASDEFVVRWKPT